MDDQLIRSRKKKSNPTSDQQITKKSKQGLDAIEERRRLREAQKKSQEDQDKKQLADI